MLILLLIKKITKKILLLLLLNIIYFQFFCSKPFKMTLFKINNHPELNYQQNHLLIINHK